MSTTADGETALLPEFRFRDYGEYFARLASQGYAVLGRGVLVVRFSDANARAVPEYVSQARLEGDSSVAVRTRELVASYDPDREVVIAFVDLVNRSVFRIGVTPIAATW